MIIGFVIYAVACRDFLNVIKSVTAGKEKILLMKYWGNGDFMV